MNRTFLALLALPIGVSGCALSQPTPDYYDGNSAAPEVGAVTPDVEQGNVGGGIVTIAGSGFGTDASQVVVQFGDHNAEIVAITDGELQVRVPTGPITGGQVPVRVATAGGYADGAYTYAIDPVYNAQTAFVQINNFWESCLGGLSDRDYRGDAGCDQVAYVGSTGMDGSATQLSFAWPRFHSENIGFFGGTDESIGEWRYERPGASNFVFGIDKLREDVGEVVFKNALYTGDDLDCVDVDGTASYRYGGGVEGFEAPVTIAPEPLPTTDSASACDDTQIAYAPDELHFCPTLDTEGVPDLVYRADWPVKKNFFAGSQRQIKPAEVTFSAANVGIQDLPVTLPESLVVYADDGFVSPFGANSPEDYDGYLWGVSEIKGCYDDDGNGERLDDTALAFSWVPTEVDLDAVKASSGGRIKGVRNYVRFTITALSLNWFGTSGYPVRATLVVPDDEGFDGGRNGDGRSHLSIPAEVLYQFPSAHAPGGGGGLGGAALADGAQSDWGYLLVTAERVTDYQVGLEGDKNLVLSYTTGDFGFFDWTNPGDADACNNCIDDDEDGYADADDPDCADGNEELGFSDAACNDGRDNDRDGLRDADDPECESATDDNEATPCTDGADNDEDGWTDLEDPGCTRTRNPDENGFSTTAGCNDGEDNDADGLSDADDPDCADATDTDETTAVTGCTDGADNDGDGWSDVLDPDCVSGTEELNATTGTECNDGIDNDGNGDVDASDSDCTDGSGETEGVAAPPSGCENETDDDGDGWTDLLDPDCATGTEEVNLTSGSACNDGVDNDGNGDIDAADPDCDSGEGLDEGASAPVPPRPRRR